MPNYNRDRSRYASDDNWDQNQSPNYRQSDQGNYDDINYDQESDWRNMDRHRPSNYGNTSYGNTSSGNYNSGMEPDEYNQRSRRNMGGGFNSGYNNYGRREDWGRSNAGNYGNDYGKRSYNYNDRYNMRYSDRDRDGWQRTSGQSMYGGDTSNYGNMNQGGYDRSWWDRTRDEVSSWFGDEDSERRRERDRRMNTGGYRGKGPKDYRRSEDRIREDVCDRLTDDDMLDATNIHIEVKGDEVILTGTVNNREQKRRAEDLVESISGVRDIENRIRINRGDESLYNTGERTTGNETRGSERNRNK